MPELGDFSFSIAPIVILLEFLVLILLALLCRQLLIWDMALQSGRDAWIMDLRMSARKLRILRREVVKVDLPELPFKLRLVVSAMQMLSRKYSRDGG